MSDIIRAVTRGFTPPPQPRSQDARIPRHPDTYRFMQNQIESQQRQQERQVQRTIRAGERASAPTAGPIKTINVANQPLLYTTFRLN